MRTYVALLRAINLGAHNPVAMADLRRLFDRLGMDEPRTLLQTGNVVFRGAPRTGASLEGLLEAEAERALGLRTDVLVRSAEEWRAVIAANPFRDEAASDPSHLVVMVLKDAPSAGAVQALQEAVAGPELIRVRGKQIYLVYPEGIGRSRLTNSVVERRLATRGTGRNWNTALKIEAALAGP